METGLANQGPPHKLIQIKIQTQNTKYKYKLLYLHQWRQVSQLMVSPTNVDPPHTKQMVSSTPIFNPDDFSHGQIKKKCHLKFTPRIYLKYVLSFILRVFFFNHLLKVALVYISETSIYPNRLFITGLLQK